MGRSVLATPDTGSVRATGQSQASPCAISEPVDNAPRLVPSPTVKSSVESELKEASVDDPASIEDLHLDKGAASSPASSSCATASKVASQNPKQHEASLASPAVASVIAPSAAMLEAMETSMKVERLRAELARLEGKEHADLTPPAGDAMPATPPEEPANFPETVDDWKMAQVRFFSHLPALPRAGSESNRGLAI